MLNITTESNLSSILSIDSEQTTSAVNAARNLFSNSNSSIKTPISLLQEICMKCHIQPIYEVLSAEGQIHEPTFVYKVTVGDISAIGKGTSKKRAKHTAALEVLNEIKLKCVGKNDELATQIESLIRLVTNQDSSLDEPKLSNNLNDQNQIQNEKNEENYDQQDEYPNPVGDLLEFTQKYSIRPPLFEFGTEEGPPHNRQFICYATLGDCKEIGMGRAKKDAKRQAAIKLLVKIKTNNLNIDDSNNNNNKNINSNNKNNNSNDNNNKNDSFFQQLNGTNKDKRNNKNSQNSFNLFKNTDKPLIKDLLTKNNLLNEELSDFNCKYLDDLSKELNFEYNYFKIPVISKSGKYQVLLQLQIHPLTVTHGSGNTYENAKKHAAYNGLLYIKYLCGK